MHVNKFNVIISEPPISKVTFAFNSINIILMNNFFKSVAILEGISYLILFFNMLFIKTSNPTLYKLLLFPLGMTHGILFVGYIILTVLINKYQKWNFRVFSIVLIASLLPFATFFVEKKYIKECINF
jgi:integral membrane protein